MNHLREVAERLRIRGDYDNRGSDVADATACTEAADELERLTAVALAARALVRSASGHALLRVMRIRSASPRSPRSNPRSPRPATT